MRAEGQNRCAQNCNYFLSGGSVYDIMDAHGVGQSTFYKCIWRTLYALDKYLDNIKLDIDNPDELSRLERGFATRTNNVIRGVVW